MAPAASSKAKPPLPLPGYDDVQLAAVRIAGKALRTPIIENPALNGVHSYYGPKQTNHSGQIFVLRCELFQRFNCANLELTVLWRINA